MATKIAPLSGFPEWLPADRLTEQLVLDIVRDTFERHGFVNIETRAVEPVDRLLGKGGDADKEIYGVSRLAADDDRDADLGLHFDLTVPFARYVLENAGKLTFPFRRYQIQKVWRGERPQEGRYREFTQADIDIVGAGELPFHYEAEIPLVIADVFERLPIGPYRIQVNNRKIPEGFYLGIGIAPEQARDADRDADARVGALAVGGQRVVPAAGAHRAVVLLPDELGLVDGAGVVVEAAGDLEVGDEHPGRVLHAGGDHRGQLRQPGLQGLVGDAERTHRLHERGVGRVDLR